MTSARSPQPSDRLDTAGQSHWFDLAVHDLADAMSFYEGLFGWSYRQMDQSPIADYVMIEAGGRLIGGLRRADSASGPKGDSAILYFTVENLDASARRAKELGAELIGAKVELGSLRGAYQWFRDRDGRVMGIWAAS